MRARSGLNDTKPAAVQVQIELMRAAGIEGRSALAGRLSTSAFQQTRRNLREAHPDATPRELDLMFVEAYYGRELAERVRVYLEARDRACRTTSSSR